MQEVTQTVNGFFLCLKLVTMPQMSPSNVTFKVKKTNCDDGSTITVAQLMKMALQKHTNRLETGDWQAVTKEQEQIMALEQAVKRLQQHGGKKKKKKPSNDSNDGTPETPSDATKKKKSTRNLNGKLHLPLTKRREQEVRRRK